MTRSDDDLELRFTFEGSTYNVRPGSFSATEAKAYRQEVGLGLFSAIAECASGRLEPDLVAGMIWIHRRRTDKRLSYSDIADAFTLDDVIDSINAADDEDDEGDDDPET